MAWRQLSVASRYPDFAAELLTAAGAQAVTLRDAADTPVLEPATGETPLWARTITVGLFPSDANLETVRALLQSSLPADDALAFDEQLIADDDWIHLWQQGVEPMDFGPRLWIRPGGKPLPAGVPADAAVVDLDPGLAFGTGTHPSTALCLDWLASLSLAGARILDYGCGSGILAIAALKLGAEQAFAVDIDPQALIATRDNAAHNGVTDRLHLCAPDKLPCGLMADFTVANILANPLVALASRLGAHTVAGGRIALSGLLPEHGPMIRAAYQHLFHFEAPVIRDGWLRLSAQRLRAAL